MSRTFADTGPTAGAEEGHAATPPGGGGGLSVEGLRVNLAGSSVPIVDDVNFSCAGGSAIGLVGESGSGKTTVGMALLGYVRPGMTISSGRVLVGGRDVLSSPGEELTAARGRLISYVPQEPASALSPSMRVGRQIDEVLDGRVSGTAERSERVAAACTAAQLTADDKMLRRYPHELSGGQQQRVAIAMALVGKPSVIVMDEPTTGLDVVVQSRLLEVIKNLRHHEQSAIVYISHDLGVIRNLVDEVVVLYAGQVVEKGGVEEIFRSPQHPYTRRLLAAVPRVDPKRRNLQGIAGSPPSPRSRPRGCFFAPRCAFVEERCRDEAPPLTLEPSGRSVRCWRVGELTGELEALDNCEPSVRKEADGADLLAVENMRAVYGAKSRAFQRSGTNSVVAVHDLSFSIREGECVALVGESGSGKTTIARCVAGLHPLASGSMRFGGAPVPSNPRRRGADLQRRIQIVFQDPDGSLNPRMPVAALIGRPLKRLAQLSTRQRAARVAELLEQVHLTSAYMGRYPAELSGGEKQRVALARALAAEPSLLVCDEVTSALDVAVQASILELLLELRDSVKMSMLFISHDLAVVSQISDRVYVLQSGELREHGEVGQVFSSPSDAYAKLLRSSIPELRPGDYPG